MRVAFSTAVIGRSVGAVEQYWQQQLFSGREVPPVTKASDDDLLALVKATPGAIGYVSAGASIPSGFKVEHHWRRGYQFDAYVPPTLITGGAVVVQPSGYTNYWIASVAVSF